MADTTKQETAPAVALVAPIIKAIPLTNPEDPTSIDWSAIGIDWVSVEPQMDGGKPTGKMIPLEVSEGGSTFSGVQRPLLAKGKLTTLTTFVDETVITSALDASGWRIPAQRVCRAKLGEWRTNGMKLCAVEVDGTRKIGADGKPIRTTNNNTTTGVLDEMHERLLRKAIWDAMLGIRGETKRAPKIVEVIKLVNRPLITIGAETYDGDGTVDDLRSWYISTYTDLGLDIAVIRTLIPGDEKLAGIAADFTAANAPTTTNG